MRRGLALVFAAIVGFALMVPAGGAAERNQNRLDAYTAEVDAAQLSQLVEQGFDVHGERAAGTDFKVDLVLTSQQRAKLAEDGINTKLTRVKGGQTLRQFAAAEAQEGFDVWRSWDEPGGFRDQLYEIAEENPDIAELVKLGTTVQGREVLAVKLTADRPNRRDGEKPAVLYSATQHAREWIAGEVNRRLMNYYVDQFRANNKEIRRILRRNELWFVPIANPDGYQYTFDVDRLWRKNLRPNNDDGEITIADGVDLNRNFPNHFNYDEEGSSSVTSSETYRGPSAVSEPETAAMKGLLDSVDFSFQVNYHSVGEWLLYADGWQVGTPTADDPIYYALSGNLDEPAIENFHPGLSSDVLYVTNGETTDYAHAQTGALAWTPELGDGCPDEDCGFVFPDDEEAVQEEFERNIPFALSVAKSAENPADPDSSLGIETKPFYIESDDPYKDGIPGANFSFDYSYGDSQPVHVLARRSIENVALKYRINGRRIAKTGTTEEWEGGERYAPTSVHYREMRGVVEGTEAGDSVEVWFRGGGRRSESFTYEVVSDTDNEVLIVAAEDYTGASPGPTPGGPHYLDYYLDALEDNGIGADVYDVDARGRTAPDHLGVLSHYDAVVWYTGDDVVTRRAGWGPGNADRLAMDEMLEFRSYMNEGGGVLYTGKTAGQQYTGVLGSQFYDPKGEDTCDNAAFDPRRCLALHGSGDGVNDILEYYFGSYVLIANDGQDPETGEHFDAIGVDDPFEGLSWGFNGPDSADNQNTSSSFVSTSGILPPDEYPQFESWPSSRYDKPGGPFAPHTGEHYVYSQIADVTYKRLTREIPVPAAGGDLNFWTSFDTEGLWDHVFVEARTAGGNDWTTLPDQNGHTTQSTGDSCPAGWRELHPQLDFYQTLNADGTCSPTGTGGGAWHAASGNSGGWQEWSVDLSEWSGETVEISISYASDWAVQNLGVFVDDVTLPDGSTTSFETDLSGWQVTGAPPGSGANANDWIRTDAAGFPVGSSITTQNSILMGFGLEGVDSADSRAAVIGRAIDYLLD